MKLWCKLTICYVYLQGRGTDVINPAINGTTLPNSLGPWSSWEKLGRKTWDSRDRIPVLRKLICLSGKCPCLRQEYEKPHPGHLRLSKISENQNLECQKIIWYIYIIIYIYTFSQYTHTFSAKKKSGRNNLFKTCKPTLTCPISCHSSSCWHDRRACSACVGY